MRRYHHVTAPHHVVGATTRQTYFTAIVPDSPPPIPPRPQTDMQAPSRRGQGRAGLVRRSTKGPLDVDDTVIDEYARPLSDSIHLHTGTA